MLKLISALALFGGSFLFAQNAAVLPSTHQRFLDSNGRPLTGGKLYTCVAGTTCPGNPLATYTDVTGTVQNANPVILDSGGFASIWIGSGNYKLVAQTSAGVQQWTQDNIVADALQINAGANAANGLVRLDSSGFVPQSVLNYTLGATGAVNRTAQSKLQESVSVKDFGAKGDGTTDDTVAVQACFDYANASHWAACYIPPSQYKITGSGLTITHSGTTIFSNANQGGGQAQLIYYGTGSALTIGDGVTAVFSTTLENFAIVPAAGVTAQYGLNVIGETQGHWYGLAVGAGGTTGTDGVFTTMVRFTGSSGIVIDGLLTSNKEGITGSTGVLFDNAGSSFSTQNSNISILHADMFMLSTVFNVLSCDDCRVMDATNLEGFDLLVSMDNTTNSTAKLNSFRLSHNSITANESTYFASRKIANIVAASGKVPLVYMLDFSDNRIILSPSVTNPISITTTGASAGGYVRLKFSGNVIYGVAGALTTVAATSPYAQLIYGWNHVYDNTGTVRQLDVIDFASGSQYYISESDPLTSTALPLKWNDTAGTTFLAGASNGAMNRPAPGATTGAGLILGVDKADRTFTDGFLRTGTIGGPSATYSNYCDYSGFSTVTDMNNNVVCFAGGQEVMRLDGTLHAVRFGGSSNSYIRGFLTATATLTFSAPATVPGCTEQTITASGLAVSDRVTVGPPSLAGSSLVNAYVTAADTATVRWCQFAGSATAPPSGSYTITAVR